MAKNVISIVAHYLVLQNCCQCIVKLALNSLTEYCANFICPLMLLPSLPRPDAGKKCFGNWDQ